MNQQNPSFPPVPPEPEQPQMPQPQQFIQPGYAMPYVSIAPQQKTSGLAIASMVLGIVWLGWLGSLLAVIFGHIALSQTKDGRAGGRGMAIAGLVLGYVGVLTFVWFLIAMGSAADSVDSGYQN